MPSSSRLVRSGALACVLVFSPAFGVENAATPAPNSDATYQQLRNIVLSSEAVAVKDFTLRRDAATFHLRSGTVCFVTPVQGKVTGAVFVGDGNMILDPPLAIERSSLKLLTKEDEFSETFDHMVMRFTDATYVEMKKAGSAGSGGCDTGLLTDSQKAMRKKLHFNLDARILQGVLGSKPDGLFVAFVHGKRYNGEEIFSIDPKGGLPLIMPVAPGRRASLSPMMTVNSGCGPAFTYLPSTKTAQLRARRKTPPFTLSISYSIPQSRRAPT